MRAPRTAAIVGLVIIIGCDHSADDRPLDDEARSAVRNVREVLGLDPPYRIVEHDIFPDGGTLMWRVRDRSSREYTFCFDGREHMEGEEYVVSGDTVRWRVRQMYAGGMHPTVENAHSVLVGGPEEKAIADLLEIISLQFFARSTRDSVVAARLEGGHCRDPRRSDPQEWALSGACMARQLRDRDPRGEIIWIDRTKAAKADSLIRVINVRRRSSPAGVPRRGSASRLSSPR